MRPQLSGEHNRCLVRTRKALILGGQDVSADFAVVGLDTATTVVVHVFHGNFQIIA